MVSDNESEFTDSQTSFNQFDSSCKISSQYFSDHLSNFQFYTILITLKIAM